MTNEEIIKGLKSVKEELNKILTNPYAWVYQPINEAIKALEQPCEDAISRQAVLCEIDKQFDLAKPFKQLIKSMPPVTPKPETGHWILIDKELSRYKCSKCCEVIRLYKKSEISKLEKDETLSDYPFSHCGCRMVEIQESDE